jgi:phage replication-related protein YjqB (UPF0714/DUF867 family)
MAGRNAAQKSADRYRSFASLAAAHVHGTDFRIHTRIRAQSPVAVIAPHGGSIERRTSAIARAVAAEDFNLYLFEGLDEAGSFDTLHITSHRFDEPQCLRLVSRCDTVVAIHGCSGNTERVMLGGRDYRLIASIEAAISDVGVNVSSRHHPYPGRHVRNICNRGRRGRGVQLEMSDALRGGAGEAAVIDAVRRVLRTTR